MTMKRRTDEHTVVYPFAGVPGRKKGERGPLDTTVGMNLKRATLSEIRPHAVQLHLHDILERTVPVNRDNQELGVRNVLELDCGDG